MTIAHVKNIQTMLFFSPKDTYDLKKKTVLITEPNKKDILIKRIIYLIFYREDCSEYSTLFDKCLSSTIVNKPVIKAVNHIRNI